MPEDSAEHWEAKAARAREAVKHLTAPDAMDLMLRIAECYDALADQERAGGATPSPTD